MSDSWKMNYIFLAVNVVIFITNGKIGTTEKISDFPRFTGLWS